MLRRVNAALFEAPAGARIQVVAESQGNNGVNDARFEYATELLPRETILGLPGCSFRVADSSEGLEAVVAFDPGAPGSARYDLFEVENGVKSDLGKSTTASQSAPLISFTIDPVAVAVVTRSKSLAPPRAAAARKTTRKTVKRKPAKRKAAKKRPGRKTAAAKKKTVARKTAARRRTPKKRGTARKRSR